MNILQLHDQVKFWIDEYGSPRQRLTDIDAAIWSAAKAIVEEKYDHSKQNHQEDSIERYQRIRDELFTLTMQTPLGASAIPVASNVIAASELPESYKYLLLLEVVALSSGNPDASTEWTIFEVVTLDKKKDFIFKNPFRVPKNDGLFNRNYYEQNVTGFFLHTEIDSLNYARISYLKEPVENYIGVERVAGYTPGSDTLAISTGDVTHSGTDYPRGDLFTITAATTFTGDNVITNFVNTDLPITLHEEIAKKAAYFILDRSNLFQKAAAFKQEILSK